MKQFRVYYWKHKNDDCVDFEKDIYAFSFDECYKAFRGNNPLCKIREIKEIE